MQWWQHLNCQSIGPGYSQYFSGSNFLPYEDTEQLGTLILGATNREKSPVLRKIVETGFVAVPELLKHLSDKRTVKLPPIESGGMMWIAFGNEYDFNSATTPTDPIGVNLDHDLNGNHPKGHEITVGDLCYVALGQIVNRNWSASRYQPTGGRIINSPTYSKDLRQIIVDEWGSLDRDGHRAKLIEDFRKPDSENRVVGAYLRLSLYYPELVEGLVLEVLNRPTPDGTKSDELLTELIAIEDSDLRKNKLNEILKDHGQHYRDSMLDDLFNRISSTDKSEENGLELDDGELKIRKILHETFDWPNPVRYKDWRRKPKVTFTDSELARLIKSFTHDDSLEIGKSVQEIMESERYKNDAYMREACLTCLASRSQFGDYLAGMLEKIDFQKATQSDFRRDNLVAIAKNKSQAIQKQLLRISQFSNDPSLFLVAANAIEKSSWTPLLERAKKILKGLPPDTDDGMQLLQLILERAPTEADGVLTDFLKPNTPSRCNTVCKVLWYGNPLSCKVLLPLLDDDRPIPGVTVNVRDRAAQALSHSIKTIRFDSDWTGSRKDKAIQEMKDHCKNKNSR